VSLYQPAAHRSQFTQNLRWALGWTFSFATAYSGYVLFLTLARRSTWFENYQISTWSIILGYYLAALLAGVALAVLRPLGDSRIGAYCLGAVIGFLVYGSIGVMMEGFEPQPFGSPQP
jgi:predicted membrane-bound spermidine synthase